MGRGSSGKRAGKKEALLYAATRDHRERERLERIGVRKVFEDAEKEATTCKARAAALEEQLRRWRWGTAIAGGILAVYGALAVIL